MVVGASFGSVYILNMESTVLWKFDVLLLSVGVHRLAMSHNCCSNAMRTVAIRMNITIHFGLNEYLAQHRHVSTILDISMKYIYFYIFYSTDVSNISYILTFVVYSKAGFEVSIIAWF